MRRHLTLTQQIFIGLFLGIILGWIINRTDPSWADVVRPFGQIFIRMIKMIIAPLIFATLVAGIAGAGHAKAVGRIGLRSIIYFEAVTTVALLLGLFAVNWVQPGRTATGQGVLATFQPAGGAAPIAARPQTWQEIFLHLVPESAIRAMADGELLQLVVFSIVFALALGMIGERGRPILVFCESLAETMFKFTNIVMKYAPVGVGAAIAYAVGVAGVDVLRKLAWLLITLYASLIVFVVVILGLVMVMFRVPVRKFIRTAREPAVIAFTTTSSEAALPRAMEAMERLGCPRSIVSFVLPLGYTFNLDGSTLYLSMASVFIAQAAGVQLSLGQQVVMMLTLMLTSKGVAGVPRAALVILAGTVAQFDLPPEGVALVMGVDHLMDMGRTSVNVIGNCLATVVVSKWEGEFVEASDAQLEVAAERGEL